MTPDEASQMYDAAVSRVVRWALGTYRGSARSAGLDSSPSNQSRQNAPRLYSSRLLVPILFTTSDLSYLPPRDPSRIGLVPVWGGPVHNHVRLSPRWDKSGAKKRVASRGFGHGKSSPQRLDSGALNRVNNLPDPRTLDLAPDGSDLVLGARCSGYENGQHVG